MTEADLISFENKIREHWRAGNLPCLLHLCGGNERALLDIFSRVRPGDWILSSHRNHYHALLAGIPAEQLEADILAGHSMFTFSREHNFLSSSILAATCAIAAGLAWAIRHRSQISNLKSQIPGEARVWCFLGDGAEEEGHFYEAALFVESHALPCTFIIEDNDRSVDTWIVGRRPLQRRRTLEPLHAFRCVVRYKYVPTYPHAGDGSAPGTIIFKPEAIQRLSSGL